MTTLAPPLRGQYAPLAARATIATARITGASLGGMPLVDFEFIVRLPNGRVVRVDSSMTVPCAEINRLSRGTTLPVRLDPDLPTSLRIDWRAA